MSAITVTVTFRNETNFVLNKQSEELVHGNWSPGLQAPSHIAPHQIVTFKTEGSTILGGPPTTGTEGNVTYAMSGEPPGANAVYFHWNSPLVESEYGNTYHEQCPSGFELAQTGGQGHEAVVDLIFRRAVPHFISNFRPSLNALHFKNTWQRSLPALTLGKLGKQLFHALPFPIDALAAGLALLPEDAIPLTHADSGLCGGMVFTTLDYWYAGLAPPNVLNTPSSEDDPLYIKIRNRLVDSFDISGQGSRYLAYTLPAYPDGDENIASAIGVWRGRAWVTYRDAVFRVRADIDAGRPSPLALIQKISFDPSAIGNHHQVLAYGYYKDASRVTFYIYDPNESDDDSVTLSFWDNDTTGAVKVWRSVKGTMVESVIRCIFVTEGYKPTPVI